MRHVAVYIWYVCARVWARKRKLGFFTDDVDDDDDDDVASRTVLYKMHVMNLEMNRTSLPISTLLLT